MSMLTGTRCSNIEKTRHKAFAQPNPEGDPVRGFSLVLVQESLWVESIWLVHHGCAQRDHIGLDFSRDVGNGGV